MKIANVVLLSVLVLGAAEVIVNLQSELLWDPVTLDVEGNPTTIASAIVGIWPMGSDPGTVEPSRMISGVPPGGTGWVIQPLLESMPKGSYDIRAAVVDDIGSVSTWSEPVSVKYAIPPRAPTGLRCR